jgi:hypothetical protein
MVEVGSVVEYVDELGRPHAALVTANFGGENPTPSLNVVYVSASESEHDSYGRQIARETSVVNEANQGAHGRYWRTP